MTSIALDFFIDGVAQLTRDYDATQPGKKIKWTDWQKTPHDSDKLVIHFDDDTEIKIDLWEVKQG